MIKSPIKLKRWQYVQLLGTTMVTVLSCSCIVILLGALFFGLHLVTSGALQWWLFVISYLGLVTATWGIDKFFYRLYKIRRAKKIAALKKDKGIEPEKKDTQVPWKDVIGIAVFIVIVTTVLLYLHFSGKDGEETTATTFNYWPVVIVVGVLALLAGFKYLPGDSYPTQQNNWFFYELGRTSYNTDCNLFF